MDEFPDELDMLDGEEEPLFGDDVMDDDDEPPPLPPPMPSLSELSRQRRPVNEDDNLVGSDQFGFETFGMIPDDVGGAGGVANDKQDAPQKKRKPLLTLKIDRIFSDKGLPWLEREFPKLKFKGKGHEASDLKYLMQQYEHWANTLYPKMTFKDLTDRIETLAKKKEFKSQLVQMRRRHIRGGAVTPPLSDVDEPMDAQTTNGLNTSTHDDDDDSTSNSLGITNGVTPYENEDNLNIDHMVSDRQSEESGNVMSSNRAESSHGRFSNTAMTRLTMDGLNSSDDESF